MLEKNDILEVIRRMELAVQESDRAAEEARARLASLAALLSQLKGWRRALKS
jgi:hypothetical protein